MPKLSNSQRQAAPLTPAPGLVGQRLARRANGVPDPERMKILAEILEESSSPLLNDISSQLMGPRQVAENHSRLLDLLDELRQLELANNPKLPQRTEESWTNFFNWIDMNNSIQVSKDLCVSKQKPDTYSSCENDEYSLVAKVPFVNCQKIFSIDRKAMLTTETASKDLDLNEFIKKDSIASGMQNVVLVLHLLNEYSKREQSYWWPYLSILPGKILPILRLNKQSLVQYLLASSHIYDALKLLRSVARQYSYYYQRLHATRLPLAKEFTFEFYAWGVSCVCSRQNEIPLGVTSREPKFPTPYHNANALIPILDMCNHNSSSNQAIFMDNTSCLFADKYLQAGDEITINYGSQTRSSGEFYIHNGFVPADMVMTSASKIQNEKPQAEATASVPSYHDVVPITIGLSKNNKLFHQKAKLLKILNMPTLGRFKLVLNVHENRHKRDPHLTMFLIVYSMNEQELELILNNSNPVGIADEIYEFVHYKAANGKDQASSMNGSGCDNIESTKLDEMKRRLAKSVSDYLLLRASVSVALIDRTLEEAMKKNKANEKETIDYHAIRLLRCEKRIFESYKQDAKVAF